MRAGRVQKVFTGPEGEVGRGWGEAWRRQVRRRLSSGFLSNMDDFPVPTYFALKTLSVCCEWILKYMPHEIKTLTSAVRRLLGFPGLELSSEIAHFPVSRSFSWLKWEFRIQQDHFESLRGFFTGSISEKIDIWSW